MSEPLSPPVERLLTLGEAAARTHAWPDYAALGIGARQVGELVRVVADAPRLWSESDGPEVWAPIHAWRALGQLRAERAIEPLVELLPELVDIDWGMNELPIVFGMLGGAAIPALTRSLMDDSLELWARAAAADSLREIAKAHPESHQDVVAGLLHQLEKWYRTDEVLNALLIGNLVDLQVKQAAPLIEQAFAEDRVDASVVGDWEDIQVELGLLAERQTPRPGFSLLPPLDFGRAEVRGKRRRGGAAKEKAKAKRKRARLSRKKNRRK